MSSSRVIEAKPSVDTNQQLAAGLAAVQKRIDLIAGRPITIGGWEEEKDGVKTQYGFPAQYRSDREPPVIDRARVYRKVRTVYGADASGLPKEPVVNMTFTEEDAKAWKDKEKMMDQADFDAWVGSTYDPHRNPAEAAWLQSVYPQYFEARDAENKAIHELQSQFTSLKINGAKSVEDLYLLYRTEKDRDLYARLSGATGAQQAEKQSEYKRGLFNPARHFRLQASHGQIDDKVFAAEQFKPAELPHGELTAVMPTRKERFKPM